MENNKGPLISIALCTYNGQLYLKEQLDSLLYQTYPNLEIIIVDDCSTDKTAAIIKEYEKAHSRIQVYLNEHNLGYTKNFEKALNLCRGEYIALCDQDDIWDKDKISKLYQNIGDALLIYHDSELIDGSGKSLNTYFSDRVKFYKGSEIGPLLLLNCVSAHAMMVHRSVIRDAGEFPEKLFHDWWLALAALAKGRITFVKEPLVFYRQHASNATDFFGKGPKKTSTVLYQQTQHRLKAFASAPFLSVQQKQEIEQLIQYYQLRENARFSIRLFMYLALHLSLFDLLYKSTTSKLNVARKESRGIKYE